MSATQGTWLTQEAHDRLKHELDELVANRPVIAAKINDAREEQGQLEARIRQLQELLRVAKVGETPTESGTAQPGMVVTVRYEGEDETETFLLGSREEGTHGDLEAYSPNSPLGRAIIGAAEGEDRKYELPNGGSMTVTIVRAEPFRG